MRTFLLAIVVACLSFSCANKKPPDTGPMLSHQEFRCESSKDPKDIVIPVELYKQTTRGREYCLARISLDDKGPKPRACRGRLVWWRVTNNCGEKVEVMVAFSPFNNNNDTKKSVRPFEDPSDYGYIKDAVRPKARATKSGEPGLCEGLPETEFELCGKAYKYDIFVKRSRDGAAYLALDPELEVEY